MNKSMAKGMLVGGIAAAVVGAGAVTGYQALKSPAHADVLAVTEAYQTVDTPQERCESVQVSRSAHRAIVEAIRRGDPQKAREGAKQHRRAARDQILPLLQQLGMRIARLISPIL